MGARRKQSTRSIGRPTGRWLRLLILIGVVVAGWQLYAHLPEVIMPIDSVQIEGRFLQLSRDEIRRRLEQELDGDYFTVDIGALRSSLLTLPWVQDASVRRQWPSTLQIRIVERQAVAYWSDDALLSDRGEVFRPASIDRNLAMPAIQGPDGLHGKVWAWLQVLRTELSGLGLEIDRLVLDERRSWSMRLSNGVDVQLGRNDTEKRMQRFVRVFAMRNAPNIDDIEYIDLRYPNGFALRAKAEPGSGSEAGLNKALG